MSYYRVAKKMIYTEVVYVEADSAREAESIAGETEGEVMHDDSWHDSHTSEVGFDEYMELGSFG